MRVESKWQGLTSQIAAESLRTDGFNEIEVAKRISFLKVVLDTLRQPMLLLLLLAGLINLLLSELLDGLILLAFSLLIVGITIIQTNKTQLALTALRKLAAPQARVLRDGQVQKIPTREIVRKDIVFVGPGDRVPADCTLVEVSLLKIDESMLTGEALPMSKNLEAENTIYAGTLVTSGYATAEVTATGINTEMGRIGHSLSTIKPPETALEIEVGTLVRRIAVISFITAAIVVSVSGLTRGDWLTAILSGIGVAMALLPEEFPVVLTVFLTMGSRKMARANVITRNPHTIETLGSITTLCVDKTGTITENKLQITLVGDGEKTCAANTPFESSHKRVVEIGALACPAQLFDPIDSAFSNLAEVTATPLPNRVLVHEYPMTDDLFVMANVYRLSSDELLIAAKGSPEALIDISNLDNSQKEKARAEIQQLAETGLRMIAVAEAKFPADSSLPHSLKDFDFSYLGWVGLLDPTKPSARIAIKECATAGIRVIMITGDNPATAQTVAADAGIDVSGGVITGDELATFDDQELARRLTAVRVFARIKPIQKLRIVKALQNSDEIVGMTGDGINDAPALTAADVGIAMGMRGNDVAREAADLVVTDDDFASLTHGIRLGRGIFNNMRKAMGYLVSVHIPIFGMAVFPLFNPLWPIVLVPVLIAFLELVIDPACSIVFEAEEVDENAMAKPPRSVTEPIFTKTVFWVAATQGVATWLGVMLAYWWSVQSGFTESEIRALTFATLIIGNLGLILTHRSWSLNLFAALKQRRNLPLYIVSASALSALLVLINLPWSQDAFGFSSLTITQWLVVLAASLLPLGWMEIYKVLRLVRNGANESAT